jgi:hypothetical protein
MVTLVGGIIALILGLLGLAYWWDPFIQLLQAGIPLVLILGGALATYLGIEEWKDSQALSESETYAANPDAERYKAEAEKYKNELETLKKAKEEAGPGTTSSEEASE